METERLWIRRFTPEDWRDLHGHLSREEVVRYEPYGVFTEEESKREAVRRSEDGRFWAVCLKDGGKLIGNLYLSQGAFDTWELGYVFAAEYQGQGYATEAAKAALAEVFRHRQARRVVALCNPLNEPSWRLLERLGMRREGHLRQNLCFKKGEDGRPLWQDTYEYAILAPEWFQGNP